MADSAEKLRDDVESSALKSASEPSFDSVALLKSIGDLKGTSTNSAAEAILSGFSLFSTDDAKSDEKKKEEIRDAGTKSASEGPDQKRIFNSTEPTESELKRAEKLSPEKIREVKTEISELGSNTQGSILDAVKANRVTALGETHYDLNGLRDDTRALLTKFADNGVTHLAVEVNKSLQPDLDNFLSGKTSDATFKEAFMGRHNRVRQNDDLLLMMKEARAAGLKVVAVDDDRDNSVSVGSLPAQNIVHRDKHMANEVSEVLKSDPKSKVVFVVGSNHLEDRKAFGDSPTAGQLLKEEWGTKGGVATFEAHLDSLHSEGKPERLLVREMNTSAAIDMSKSIALKNLEGSRASRYDNVLLYPPTHTIQSQESRLGKDHPDLIPTLQRTAEHFVESKRLDEAMQLQERAVKIAEQHNGEVSAPSVQALNELAKTQALAGKDAASIKTFETAFSTAKQLPENERGILAVVGSNLADKHISERSFQKAEEAVTTALQVLQKDEKGYREALRGGKEGLKDANPILIAENMANNRMGRRGTAPDLDRSERLLTQLVDLAQAHGKEKDDTFRSFSRVTQLADLHETKGNFQKAEELLGKAADLAGQTGDKHWQQESLSATAAFLTRRERYDDAAPLLEKRLQLADASPAGNSVAARVQLAENLAHRDKNGEADALFNKALGLSKSESDQRLTVLAYAKFLERNNQQEKAEALKKSPQ